ncbi:MAG: hypothetical protein GX425_07750 [Peptococcaceae bacterium]|nr:hypothetical protein [Peptococcaceae bacterium]
MLLSKVESHLIDLKNKYNQAIGQLSLLEEQLDKKRKDFNQIQNDIQIWQMVQILFTKTTDAAREQLKTRIEETVTAALLAVFGEGYTFKINVRNLSGQPAAEWQVISRYGDIEVAAGPEDARGGGIVDIVSLALRLSLLELARPKPGGPVILDEPAKMVSAEYLPNVAEFLKQYAARTGRQIILVTHAEPLAEVADVSYRVMQRNGTSEVTRA